MKFRSWTAVLLLTAVVPAQARESLSTDIARCPSIDSDAFGGAARICEGPAGYSLLIESDDNRSTVSIIAPQGKTHPLELWNVVTEQFFSLGDKAEWRMSKDAPRSLILRVNVAGSSANNQNPSSYWLIAKMT